MKACCLFLVILLAGSALGDSLVVITSNGKVNGKLVKNEKWETEYFSYNCIPYAKPPVGNLRFMAPKPAESWTETLNSQSCQACPHLVPDVKTFIGDENCLTLNVFSPIDPTKTNKNEPLPVMVFIHGGDWRCDTGENFSPTLFMRKKNVMLVTFNYRLGPLGFLSTGDEIVPGNNGLKDQVMALKWIQKNIAQFGGNPRKVTIFGSNTGAASVRYHMLSPMSKGLFVGAIAQGGNELNTVSWQTTAQAVITYRNFANKLNCSLSDAETSINCLKQIPFQTIVQTEVTDFEEDRFRNAFAPFKPVIEVPNDNAFLCKHPVLMLKNGEGNDVPLILGFTENDGAFGYSWFYETFRANTSSKLIDNLTWLLPKSSLSWRTKYGITDQILSKVRDFYLPEECLDNPDQVRSNLMKLISDSWALQSHNELIKLHQKSMSSSIYQYVLSYRGDHSFVNWRGMAGDFGAAHYDEELYLFEDEYFFKYDKRSAADVAIIGHMIHLWTNFAIHQTPTPITNNTVNWEPVRTSGNEYLDINGPNALVMKRDFHYERAEFWRNLAYEFGTDEKKIA